MASVNGREEADEIRARYKLSSPTYKTLYGIPNSPSRQQVLQTACQAFEFRTFPIKQAERALLREINDHTAIPYPVAEAIAQPWHKVFVLVQAELARTGWPNKISAAGRRDLLRESGQMYKLLERAVRCVVDILGDRGDGRGVAVGLDVLRSLGGRVWEGGPMELLQVRGIGKAKMERLVEAGVKSVRQLKGLEFYAIERLLSRNPPFGHEVLAHLAGFPVLTMGVGAVDAAEANAAGLRAVRVVLGYGNEGVPRWCRRSPWVTLVIEGEDGRLVWFWRGSVKRLQGGKEMVIGVDAGRGETLKASFACEEIVGTIVRQTFVI